MLARGALCRLAAEAPTTTPHKLPRLARLLQRTLLARNAPNNPAARAFSRAYVSALHARRSYATTTRATKPTETVKRAVKAKAAKKPAAKKTTATATKAKRSTKAAVKKTATKKTAAKKTVAKKAASKKAVPKKRVPLTPEQKELAKFKALRKTALRAPVSPRPLSAFNVYIAEGTSGKHDGTEGSKESIATLASRWKTLSPAELEHYNHLANEKTIARQAEHTAWIQSHTPDEIRLANNARVQLRSKFLSLLKGRTAAALTHKLVDDRAAKRNPQQYVVFCKERHASGDMKGIKLVDASRLISSEWKALSDSEKQKYKDISKSASESAASRSVTP